MSSLGQSIGMIRAVLLDLYDTLVCANWHHVVGDMVTRLGIDERTLLGAFEATREGRGTGRFRSVKGDIRAVMVALGLPRDDDARVSEIEAGLIRRLSTELRVYDDAPRFLAALRRRGLRSAVVSNCDHATRAVLDHIAIPLDVDTTVLSCEVGSLKPGAGIFQHALAAVGARPEEAIFIDDQARYLDGARALGIQTRHILREESYGEPSESGSHEIVRSLDELLVG